ncbi:MAG: TerB family tellurite resistance protein [Candidatus Thiodiazotropha sp. (ex Myrtea sp. 'scaly one' KF741663)]|nr:TerB family tellurite resistance protein [Candidatus Thiodiazotropha sp. (ex Myrtea sp. 'scaly one' KF741663)]
MIKSIQRFFDTYLAPENDYQPQNHEARIRLAVAALLLEIAESDFSRSSDEKQEIVNIVRNDFNLTDAQAEALFSLAEREHAESTDYFQFTRLINQHYTADEKIGLVEALWRVAFADKVLHDHEEHVIRRLSDLIHVSHKDFIAAKHRVMQTCQP